MLNNVVRHGLFVLLVACGFVRADQPATLDNNTGYIALGDSLAAGKGAIPATNGYAYLLYQGGVFDTLTNTNFANAAVPGAISADVALHQVPQAIERFFPLQRVNVVTLSVGGNDLLSLLEPAHFPPTEAQVAQVLTTFGTNLFSSLAQLCTGSDGQPRPELQSIYVGNLYSISNLPLPPQFAGLVGQIVEAFNQTVENVVLAANFPVVEHGGFCTGRVKIADVYAAFSGSQEGLLLINRSGAGAFEVHPTNAGYRAMAAAYKAAHRQP